MPEIYKGGVTSVSWTAQAVTNPMTSDTRVDACLRLFRMVLLARADVTAAGAAARADRPAVGLDRATEQQILDAA
jgi:hypothetical protein